MKKMELKSEGMTVATIEFTKTDYFLGLRLFLFNLGEKKEEVSILEFFLEAEKKAMFNLGEKKEEVSILEFFLEAEKKAIEVAQKEGLEAIIVGRNEYLRREIKETQKINEHLTKTYEKVGEKAKLISYLAKFGCDEEDEIYVVANNVMNVMESIYRVVKEVIGEKEKEEPTISLGNLKKNSHEVFWRLYYEGFQSKQKMTWDREKECYEFTFNEQKCDIPLVSYNEVSWKEQFTTLFESEFKKQRLHALMNPPTLFIDQYIKKIARTGQAKKNMMAFLTTQYTPRELENYVAHCVKGEKIGLKTEPIVDGEMVNFAYLGKHLFIYEESKNRTGEWFIFEKEQQEQAIHAYYELINERRQKIWQVEKEKLQKRLAYR